VNVRSISNLGFPTGAAAVAAHLMRPALGTLKVKKDKQNNKMKRLLPNLKFSYSNPAGDCGCETLSTFSGFFLSKSHAFSCPICMASFRIPQ